MLCVYAVYERPVGLLGPAADVEIWVQVPVSLSYFLFASLLCGDLLLEE